MKKQNSSCAQMRIGFYEASLQRKNTLQLVDEFNRLAHSRGWTAERSYFTMALINAMLYRGIDISAIAEWDEKSDQIRSVRYDVVGFDEVSNSLVSLS